MVKDPFGREITYLRVSVTDRCNLACRYCVPAGGYRLLPGERILTCGEIEEVVRRAALLGIRKVRLTGGEPLVRKGIEVLVEKVARVRGIGEVAMTTNGILLAGMARRLKAAGLARVNVSLDAIRPERYAAVTGGGDVARVLEGIDAALDAGLIPVKLNCVVERSPAEPDAVDVARYAETRNLQVRFIRRMDAGRGAFWKVLGGAGGDCPRCDRLRLTSDGLVKPCLFSRAGFSVRELGAREALLRAVLAKPRRGGRAAGDDAIRRAGG